MGLNVCIGTQKHYPATRYLMLVKYPETGRISLSTAESSALSKVSTLAI